VPRYLAFVLHAPMAAFGALAVGERRPGWDRPGRSALLGLVGAALGLDRADEAGQLALDRGYGTALRTDAPGRPLADYHTAQVPPARRNQRYATRAEELAAPDLGTILTRREYRTDALHLAALWERDGAPYSLDRLKDALRTPGYTLYLGRKSCPFGLPLAPELFDAPDPAAALSARADAASSPELAIRRLLSIRRSGRVALDAGTAEALGLAVARIEHRRDRVASRRRWQFALREEAVLRAERETPT